MLKKIFISAILLLAVTCFVLSLLKGNNNPTDAKAILNTKSCIAVININGAITTGEEDGGLLETSGTGTSSNTLMKEIRSAAEDNSVKAVLLRINSPGGSVTAAEEVGRELARFKETTHKPIVASMGDMGASAAYWLAACQSDKIYANASTLTGSIGVYMPYMNTEELYKKIGITSDKIKSGVHKDIMSPDRPMTPEEKEILQNMVNEMYNQFVTVVAAGRKMDPEQVRRLADGRVYTGKQAKELGLVDEIGNYYDALAATGNMVGLGDKPTVKTSATKHRWDFIFNSGLQNMIRQEILNMTKGQLEQGSSTIKIKG
jgi:protease-4